MSENIFTQMQQNMGLWTKAWDEHLARMNAISEEVAKLENKGVTQAATAVDEMAKMTRESLAYGSLIAAEWRRVTLDAAKRTADMLSGR